MQYSQRLYKIMRSHIIKNTFFSSEISILTEPRITKMQPPEGEVYTMDYVSLWYIPPPRLSRLRDRPIPGGRSRFSGRSDTWIQARQVSGARKTPTVYIPLAFCLFSTRNEKALRPFFRGLESSVIHHFLQFFFWQSTAIPRFFRLPCSAKVNSSNCLRLNEAVTAVCFIA